MLENFRRRNHYAGALLSIPLLTFGLLLTGCAPQADPTVARESLEQVTEDPSTPDAAETYDAKLHPEPLVDAAPCSPVLIITARGTGEPSKGQLLSPVARAITAALPDDTDVIDLGYPADTDIKEGGTLGARLLVDTLNVQAAECPDQQFVLLGYSQGALVIGDALSTPESRLVGATVGTIAPAAADQVSAVVFYGDPRFYGAEPFNVGDFDPALGGLLPRPAGSLDAFADRIQDFCVGDDFVCQTNIDLATGMSLDEEGHVSYYSNGMQQAGANYVVKTLGLSSTTDDSKTRSKNTPDSETAGSNTGGTDARGSAASDADARDAGSRG